MKQKIMMLLVLLASTFSAISQDVNVYWGKTNPIDRKASTRLIGKRGSFVFAYKQQHKRISIVKYNLSDLAVVGEYPALGKPDKDGGKIVSDDYMFDDIETLKDAFYMSVTKYDKSSKQNSLYLQEIGADGKITGSLKKMESIEAKSKYNRGSFDLIESTDSTKLLLVDYPPYDKYGGEKFTFNTFDQHLNPLKKLQVELPFKDKEFDLDDITYAKDGNIYLMAKIWLQKEEKQKGEAKFYYELISISPDGDGSVAQYDIKLPGKYVDGISYDADGDKDVICSGFYGNMSGAGKGDITGIFFMRLDKGTKQVIATGVKDLDKDFIADLTSTRKANKGKGISSDFKLRHFIRKTDGGAVLIAEYSYDYAVTVTTSDGHGGMSTRTDYHYVRNNIIAVSVNPDGSIKWCADIPKYQHTINDNGAYDSFMMATKDNRMYFVYNDNPDNMLPPGKPGGNNKVKTMSNTKKSTAVVVELTEDGQFTKKAMFSNKGSDATLMPAHYMMIDKNEFIVPAYNPGFWCCISFSSAKSKLARVEFK